MKSVIGKIAILSMVGMMQLGFGSSVIEASPVYNGGFQHVVQFDDRHNQERHDQDRHERERNENERHEREMRRRDHENDREWHERQRIENERHEENMRRIAHDILELILDR